MNFKGLEQIIPRLLLFLMWNSFEFGYMNNIIGK